MLTLCGFAVSNYYNKVKLALLEKQIPFNESLVMTGSSDEQVLCDSPLGKVPYLRTPQGGLCESQVINDYLEAAYPQTPLLPADPFEAAKVRELCTFIDLHLELVARDLYAEAFFGGKVSDETKARVRKQLSKHIPGFKRLAKFGPFVAGEQFSLADCSAYVSLPLVALATKKVLGEDLLAAAGIDWKAYSALIGQRPSAQKVDADKKADAARMAQAAAQKG
jgi:glutathione S-transferase